MSDDDRIRKYRDAARRLHQEDGTCEIDDNAVVSFSDDSGAYVQAWVWVDGSEVGESSECRHCGREIHMEASGSWVDESHGDGCIDDKVHEPAQEEA